MNKYRVYSKDGRVERCRLTKVEYSGTFMGDRVVTSSFTSATEIAFEVFDYIEFRGEKFELEMIPTVKKVSSYQYEYDLRFVSLKYELERCMFRDFVPNDNEVVYPTPVTVEFTGKVNYLTERIQACLDRMYGAGVWSIVVSEGVDSEEKNLSLSNQNCWNALSLVNTEYKLNFHINGRTVIVGDSEAVQGVVFEYGKGNGLYEIERAADSDTGIVTKLIAYGGTRNLDYSYPKKPEWSDSVLPNTFILSPLRLMLPSFKKDGKTDYLLADDALIAKYGIREGVMMYDDIYPTITGATNSKGERIDKIAGVDAITDEETSEFDVYLNDLGFDLNDSLTTETPQLVMKTGALQGYAFNIKTIGALSNGGVRVTLEKNSIDNSDTGGYYIPNKDFNMSAGDEFVLLGILMPQLYIRNAEQRLEERAREYLNQYSTTNYSYSIGVDEIFMAKNPSVMAEVFEGKKMKINDDEIGINEELVTIQSLTIEDGDGLIPRIKVTLNNNPSASTLERIQGQIANIESTANSQYSAQTELAKQYQRKLNTSFFHRLFVAIDANGKEIAPNDTTTPIASVRVNYGLWTEQFLSAKGMNSGGGSDEPTGGATTLGGLRNVAADADRTYDVAKMLVLEADSNLWTLKNLSELVGGLDEAELAAYLTNNNYAKKGDIPSLEGYATEQWVLGKGYLTEHQDLSAYAKKTDIPTIPTKVSAFENDADYATTSDLDSRIDALVNGAPAAYDTLKEIADVLAGNVNSISDILTALGNKADKATTLSGYGITDAYTIAQIDSIVNGLSGNISTLQGYFTDGVANSALKLSDNGSYKAWGQTFFTNGKPKSVSGALTDVTTITTSGAATIGGTLSNQVSHLIYDSDKANRLSIAWVNGLSCIYSLKADNSGYNDLRLGVTGNTSSQLYFDASESKWGIGTSTPEYKLDVNGEARVTKLVIGDGTIEWDADNNGFKVTGGLYSTSYISAKGANTNGGSSSGGGLIESLWKIGDLGKTFNKDANDTFNAYAINAIHNRVSVLEGKATNVSFTQSLTSGTQIGTITIDGASKNIYAPTIPTSDINKGVTAHGWGNHANVGYLTSASSLAWGKITGKPTTISGYGITDAYTISQVDSALGGYLPKSGGTLTSNNVALTIKRYTSNPIIGFNGGAEGANERYGYLGFSGKDRPAYIDATGSAVYLIIHSGNIGSQSVASASDADKLDGKHLTDIINYIENPTTAIDLNSYTANEGINVISYNNASSANVANSPYSHATGVLSFGSRYPMQFATPYISNKLVFRSYYNGWYDWREIAFTDSNVASATKLQTARTIWGQSFDGTGDVSGAMSGITTIDVSGAATFGSTLTTANNIRVKATTATTRHMYVENSAASISVYVATSGNRGLFDVTNSKWLLYTNSSKIFIQSYPVEIANDVVCNATLHATTGIWSDGYVSAKGQNTSSDMRLKNVLNDVVLSVKDIANAPSVRFSWKNGGGVDVGSSAQYWQGPLPDAVKGLDGTLEMQYGNIALLSAIAIAKKVEKHEEKIARVEKYEDRIARLEKENKELRNEINMMKGGLRNE